MKTPRKTLSILGVGIAALAAGIIGTAQPASAAGLAHPTQIGQTLVADHDGGFWQAADYDSDHRRDERRREEFRQEQFRQAEFRRQQEIRREEERRREERQRDHRDYRANDRHDDHRDWHQDNHDWHSDNR